MNIYLIKFLCICMTELCALCKREFIRCSVFSIYLSEVNMANKSKVL